MKKMTFAVWFTALLAVFTFSSCLDSENNGQRQGAEIVKVEGGFGMYEFKSVAGFRLIPTNMSQITMDINTRYAFIAYSFETEQVNQETKKVPITLSGIMPIKPKYTQPTSEGLKDFSNAPVRNISAGGSYDVFPVMFWDATTMFLPINYFIKDYGDNSSLQKEIDSHNFEIFLDLDDEEAYSENLVLRVGHRVADPSLNKERRSKINTNIYEVDLGMAIGMFKNKNKNEKNPSRIIIKYDESYAGEYVENQMTPGRVEINYQSILDETKR